MEKSSLQSPDKLFTPRFFILWAYNFIVFLSAFQLLPTAPFHILSLGGSHAEAGLFLGFLTYSSAISAPITGALADRWGKRNMLLVAHTVTKAALWRTESRGAHQREDFPGMLPEWRVNQIAQLSGETVALTPMPASPVEVAAQ